MQTITFRVHSQPRPAGSKKGFVNPKTGGVIITDASKHIKKWKAAVTKAALEVAPDTPLNGPLQVTVVFLLPRPKAHYGTGKNAGVLKDNAPMLHIKMPDALKLMRGTEDAMTKIIYKDDALICDEHIYKRYDEDPGAKITIRCWEETA